MKLGAGLAAADTVPCLAPSELKAARLKPPPTGVLAPTGRRRQRRQLFPVRRGGVSRTDGRSVGGAGAAEGCDPPREPVQ